LLLVVVVLLLLLLLLLMVVVVVVFRYIVSSWVSKQSLPECLVFLQISHVIRASKA